MKTCRIRNTFICAGVGLALSAASAQATQVWHRATDWVPGTTQGGITNNPSSVNGAAVWQYETVHGGGLGSQIPWYASPGQLMTWDPAWYGTGWGVWSAGDNLNPPILPGRLVDNVATSVFASMPLVRWLNPMGNGSVIDITGTMTVGWNGVNGLGRPDNVDVVIARRNASNNTVTVLFSDTVSKPNPFPSVGDSVFLPVSLQHVTVNQGDSIVITQRGQSPVGPLGAWINLYDDLTISTIPTPGALGLLGMSGLVATRRKRR